ncbi:MAG TPA: intradiol ring-cleavage dioxygenase [Rhizobacter sp.]|nr:intradiol ring-cleavage dioxygenase [Rhizobacter sp.]
MPHAPRDHHDLGLAHDLHTLAAQAQRRKALGWIAALGSMGAGTLFVGCGGGSDDDATTSSSTSSSSNSSGSSSSSTTTSSCAVIPEETEGPYPGDGSNSANGSIANALMLSGIVRSDIRRSIAGANGLAAGVPLTLTLRLVNTRASCADLSGYAIYLWHCDQQGRYSMYSSGVTAENYLRGVQATDTDGTASFVTVFPGCYAGRMPHMHFEIYRNTSTALSYTNKLKTSQLAFPDEVCDAVYASSGYTTSASNYARMSFASDGIFSDGVTLQMSSVTGSVADGYLATLTVGISI